MGQPVPPALGIGNRPRGRPNYRMGVGQTDMPPGGAIEGPAHTWPGAPSGPPVPVPPAGTPAYPHPVRTTFNGGAPQVDGGNALSPYPESCGICVAAGNRCEYDPAVFCGWSALPFSTFKSQGSDTGINTGPITANWGSERVIEITAERACNFRVRGLWHRSLNTTDLAIGVSLLVNVTINDNPKVLEIGIVADATRRVGIPTSIHDGPFWVLPVDWGVLGPIDNESRPLKLHYGTPEPSVNQEIIGVLFGDPIVGGVPAYGNTMVAGVV